MSYVCPAAKCREKEGPCRCEKIGAVVVVLFFLLGIFRLFVA